ncbi:hypothetical protein CLOM_g15794 [Closterium sp. NIES-68]|nr:hypothetical protein CLOM_g15794 [Closterium sp. NIES-68]GJP59385.1 hypothetical protein CLOP_g11706 [Closterium sp. NIES-67]GJP78755.1 hypothetical protein CLOP_g9030 [Closterium sp. NIES-67]
MKWANLELMISAIRAFVPELASGKHKGQAGKIAVIGGCREYTGAPFFAAFSALKLGADIAHVFCSREAAPVIKAYSPELIVHPALRESYDVKLDTPDQRKEIVEAAVKTVSDWLSRMDCVVIGPGLGRDSLLQECVADIMTAARQASIPMVIDADGLHLVSNQPHLITSYPLAILTPNVNEFSRLSQVVASQRDSTAAAAASGGSSNPASSLAELATDLGNVTIVEKGAADGISDGKTVLECGLFGSPRRCGGQGDVLSGSIAVFFVWARKWQQRLQAQQQEGVSSDAEMQHLVAEQLSDNPAIMAAFAGSLVVRRAASAAFAKNKRSMTTTNIIECLGDCVEDLFPVGPWESQPKL